MLFQSVTNVVQKNFSAFLTRAEQAYRTLPFQQNNYICKSTFSTGETFKKHTCLLSDTAVIPVDLPRPVRQDAALYSTGKGHNIY